MASITSGAEFPISSDSETLLRQAHMAQSEPHGSSEGWMAGTAVSSVIGPLAHASAVPSLEAWNQ